MGKKKREVEMDTIIPLKPTANITNSMRAEKSPEVFENVNLPPKNSDSEYQTITSKGPGPLKSIELSKRIRRSVIKITGKNNIVEFPVNIVGTISQSSGTVSYDSFKELQDDFLESFKKQLPIQQKEPAPTIGSEIKVLTNDEIPVVEIIDDVKFCCAMRQEHQDPPYEQEPPSPAKHKGLQEHELAKNVVADAMLEYLDSGRGDVDFIINYNPTDVYPILNMQFTKRLKP